MKHISQRFEEEDRREQQKLSTELLEKRRTINEEFHQRRAEHRSRYERERTDRIKLRQGVDVDIPPKDTIEEKVEVIVKTQKTEIKEE